MDLRSQPPDLPPSDLDLKVVSHVRGYPDELRRFSNLIKQAHPRGKSAVEFYLSRDIAGTPNLVVPARESPQVPSSDG